MKGGGRRDWGAVVGLASVVLAVGAALVLATWRWVGLPPVVAVGAALVGLGALYFTLVEATRGQRRTGAPFAKALAASVREGLTVLRGRS
ncbi:hypothetical protein [Oryzihumus leptocrescens]|uniref:Uncharacterized protein n=1 Tax=Oryzihumus leptocrescens TaxID=297536 RepID=A0A542ZH66_9MICO|nr:hypothetical protein [Oryzihumus leptocrescens]TQL59665.1 hypothetical protein FB474_1027 [Oryzihumus leptocrescens]